MNVSRQVKQRIYTDWQRYTQVLFALLGNAVKNTFAGEIRLDCFMRDEFLVTRVEDTGTGIKEANLSKLFKYFGIVQRANKINKSGLGIGLTISKGIV